MGAGPLRVLNVQLVMAWLIGGAQGSTVALKSREAGQSWGELWAAYVGAGQLQPLRHEPWTPRRGQACDELATPGLKDPEAEVLQQRQELARRVSFEQGQRRLAGALAAAGRCDEARLRLSRTTRPK